MSSILYSIYIYTVSANQTTEQQVYTAATVYGNQYMQMNAIYMQELINARAA